MPWKDPLPSPHITPRNLGTLCLEDACERCFWILSKLRFKAPFTNFGAALFSDCQAMEEAVLTHYLETDGHLPERFSPFDDVISRVDVNKHYLKYGYMHSSGVWLCGAPDEVLRRSDDTFIIGDHKTAHPKNDDDPDRFAPQYRTQVTGYAMIGELGLELGTASGAALFYWDLAYKAVVANPSKFIKNGQLWAYFEVKVKEVELDYAHVDKLLKQALRIWDSQAPPNGRDGCKDCKRVEAFFGLQQMLEDDQIARDNYAWARSNNHPGVWMHLARRFQDRRFARLKALWELEEQGEDLTFTNGSMASNWEFLG